MGSDRINEKNENNQDGKVQEKAVDTSPLGWNGDKNFSQDLNDAKERMLLLPGTQKIMDEFPKFDTDADGFLTKDELSDAMKSNQDELTRKGLQRLIDNYDSVMGKSDDEWFFERSGVTRKDLSQEQQTQQDQVDDALDKALEKRGISDLDTDKNGKISREELSAGIEKGNADDKLMLDFMLRKYDDIKSATSLIVWDEDEITANDWSVYNHPYGANDPLGQP